MIHFKTIFKSILVLALIAVSLQALAVWVDPTDIAPKKNAESPINVGMTGQTKLGAFRAGGIRAETSIIAADGILGTPDIPNSSSVLELRSTAKGFLPPRMNKAQRDAIASPATGLLVYQTNDTPGFYFFNGTLWVPVGVGGGSGGGIGGNGTVNHAVKFISVNTIGDSSILSEGDGIEALSDMRLNKELFFSTLGTSVSSNNTNNYVTADAVYHYLTVSPNLSTVTIQGFAPPDGEEHINGRILYINNFTFSSPNNPKKIVIKNNSSSTSPNNRIQSFNNSDITLSPHETLMLVYSTSFPGGARWIAMFKSP